MSDILLIPAGILGMVIAVAHGMIGETKVVRPVQGLTLPAKRVLHALMFLSAVYWFAAGAVLAIAPIYFNADAQFITAMIVAAVFASGALGNAWATGGRHPGCWLLALATGMALTGGFLLTAD